jgi:hypothetical protein
MIRSRVDGWFDPMDPWSWVVSRWLLEVEKCRDVEVRFHVMSVSILNAGREVPEQYADAPAKFRARMQRALGPVRVATAAAAGLRDNGLAELYSAMGTRIHEQGVQDYEAVVAGALADVGLPADLARAAATEEYDEQIAANNRAAMGPVGLEIGTPILHIDGSALFGPVISKIPRGEAAGRLFDALRTLAGFPHLSELKRARIAEPDFS